MTALNRFYWPTKFHSREDFLTQKVKCVFISYQSEDKKEAKRITDYLLQAGVNVYFDEYDVDLKNTNQKNNPTKVTDALCKGINNSSHMMVIVSPSTIISKWVPFEIGYGYDKTNLTVLCLKGIPKGNLPEYIRSARIIRDIYDLNSKVAEFKNIDKEVLIETQTLSKHSNPGNLLQGIMDSLITEDYS